MVRLTKQNIMNHEALTTWLLGALTGMAIQTAAFLLIHWARSSREIEWKGYYPMIDEPIEIQGRKGHIGAIHDNPRSPYIELKVYLKK
jgi:hypothetical protein